MKFFTLLFVIFISFSAVCDDVKEGIDVNIKLLTCLDEKIPNSAIKNPEDKTAKSLLLLPSVIERTMKIESSDESKRHFLLTMKYCEKEVQAFTEHVEQQTDK